MALETLLRERAETGAGGEDIGGGDDKRLVQLLIGSKMLRRRRVRNLLLAHLCDGNLFQQLDVLAPGERQLLPNDIVRIGEQFAASLRPGNEDLGHQSARHPSQERAERARHGPGCARRGH